MSNKTIEELATDIKWMMKKLDDIHEQTKSTNRRLRKVEIWKATLMGKVAGVVLALSLFIPVVIDSIKKVINQP